MMQVCNNNNNNEIFYKPGTSPPERPKRDFRIQVCEVNQPAKWLIWPSKMRHSSHDENMCTDSTATTFQPYSQQAEYGTMRRSLARISQRRQDKTEATTQPLPEQPRRMSVRKEKAATEPLNAPTFKIISIARKSADDDDVELVGPYRSMSVDEPERCRSAQ